MRTVYSVIGAVLLSSCTKVPVSTPSPTRDPSHFTYTQISCTPNQQSRFENVTVNLSKASVAPPAQPLYAGGNRAASTVLLVGADAGWGRDDVKNGLNHPAPASQFVVILAGRWSVTTSDGETRHFTPGQVLRVEDIAPCAGHITAVGDQPGFLMFAR